MWLLRSFLQGCCTLRGRLVQPCISWKVPGPGSWRWPAPSGWQRAPGRRTRGRPTASSSYGRAPGLGQPGRELELKQPGRPLGLGRTFWWWLEAPRTQLKRRLWRGLRVASYTCTGKLLTTFDTSGGKFWTSWQGYSIPVSINRLDYHFPLCYLPCQCSFPCQAAGRSLPPLFCRNPKTVCSWHVRKINAT